MKDIEKDSLAYLLQTFPEETTNIMESFLKPSEEKIKKIEEAYAKLEEFHSKATKDETTKEKGDLLEKFMLSIFSEKNCFEIKANKRTSTNEIDIIVNIKNWPIVKSLGLSPRWLADDHFLIECKNYTEKVGVPNLNKFHSLLTYTGSSLGIFATYNGIKGTGWSSAKGLVKKINLMNKANQKLPIMLVISKTDIELLRKNKYNALSWFGELKKNIDFEIPNEELHENSSYLSKKLKN